jgi:hypothetical protein
MRSVRTSARTLIIGGTAVIALLLNPMQPSYASAGKVRCKHVVTDLDVKGAPVFEKADGRSKIIKYKPYHSVVTSPAKCAWYKHGPDGWRYVPVYLATGGIAWMWWEDLDGHKRVPPGT